MCVTEVVQRLAKCDVQRDSVVVELGECVVPVAITKTPTPERRVTSLSAYSSFTFHRMFVLYPRLTICIVKVRALTVEIHTLAMSVLTFLNCVCFYHRNTTSENTNPVTNPVMKNIYASPCGLLCSNIEGCDFHLIGELVILDHNKVIPCRMRYELLYE